MKKAIALLVSCVLLTLTLATSCGSKKENTWTLQVGESEKTVPCVLTVDGQEISYDFFRYFYLNFKADIEEQDSKIDWTKEENQKNLLDRTIEQLKYMRAAEILAQKYNFELNADEKSEIDNTMKSVFDAAGGADAFKGALSDKFLTPEVYERVLTLNTLRTALVNRLIGTDKEQNKIVITFDEALKVFSQNYARIALVGFDVDPYDSEGNEVDEKTFEARKKQKKAEADAAYNKLKNGDFLTLMKDYYEKDTEIDLQSYVPIENINKIFNIDYSKVAVGTVSEPMLADITYLILYRMEPDKEYLEKNAKSEVIANYAETKINEQLSEISKTIEVKTTDDYKLITPQTII